MRRMVTDEDIVQAAKDAGMATEKYVDQSVTGLVAQSELEEAIEEVEAKIPVDPVLSLGTNTGGDPVIEIQYTKDGEHVSSEVAFDKDKFEIANDHLTTKGGGGDKRVTFWFYSYGTTDITSGTNISGGKCNFETWSELSAYLKSLITENVDRIGGIDVVVATRNEEICATGYVSPTETSWNSQVYFNGIIISNGNGSYKVADAVINAYNQNSTMSFSNVRTISTAEG